MNQVGFVVFVLLDRPERLTFHFHKKRIGMEMRKVKKGDFGKIWEMLVVEEE